MYPDSPWHLSLTTLWALHLVGFIGLGLYLREILDLFEGVGGLVDTLFGESYLIRQAETELTGIYFSYFGWMAIPLTVMYWRLNGRPGPLLLAAFVLQCAGNLLFIDRTRPIWLVFVSVLIVFPFVRQMGFRQLALRGIAIALFGVAAFYAIGFWVGKTGEGFSFYGFVGVQQEYAILYYYFTSGFAYFEAILAASPGVDYLPQRTLYPLFKALSMLGFAEDPPLQVLPFIETPFPANVGTFLEPYFSDGGMPYLAIGVLLSTLGTDLVALLFLRNANPFALYCWANFCFASFISFFVPKLVSTPIWLFVTVALASMALRAVRPFREARAVEGANTIPLRQASPPPG
jgi:hypothetical protein